MAYSHRFSNRGHDSVGGAGGRASGGFQHRDAPQRLLLGGLQEEFQRRLRLNPHEDLVGKQAAREMDEQLIHAEQKTAERIVAEGERIRTGNADCFEDVEAGLLDCAAAIATPLPPQDASLSTSAASVGASPSGVRNVLRVRPKVSGSP